MTYQFKTNFFKTDPNIAGKVCEDLARDGRLTAKDLVDVSRPEDAPLHKEFEWDDHKAAEMFRQKQAQNIIVNLVAIEAEEQKPTRAFFNVTFDNVKPGSYEETVVIMSDKTKREKLLEIARQELKTFKNKYQELKELSGVFAEIDKLEEETA